ncbi:hypothetical protein NIES2119_25395 [[Phormidium ambiguum] IAM M-71]|uniref:Uncharacterized protein n=1 Tax=[Phormidium ambiguum] IAM M-71 TaxID=454136 RepID=A0A1U7I8K4_9CYAN|nr:hypothetical protein [Phormidium ambiguum]OKH32763.1 hypothetical protein NIES2119_25395 [Phormidium ambiguum IAM M-71]
MTFQTVKIQALIAEIDAVLSKDGKSRFGWLVGEGNADRQMLERVRHQLQKWQEQLTIIQATGTESAIAEISSYQILFEQADAEDDRALLSESLQTEVALLQQQRQELLNEIAQLQQQRKSLVSPEILVEQQQIVAEFSQTLLDRLQETINQQLTETLEKIQAVQLTEELLETSLNQETESAQPEFIIPEISEVNPRSKLINAVGPLPYAGVELTLKSREQVLENKDFVSSQLIHNDTISALTDLIVNVPETTASLEEDLLTTELANTKPNVDLWLGNNLVDQLNEELSDLEIAIQPDIQTTEEVKETVEDATDSIDLDLAAAVEEQEKNNTTIPEDILAEFEDLFGDNNNTTVVVSNLEPNPEKNPVLATNQETLEPEKKN